MQCAREENAHEGTVTRVSNMRNIRQSLKNQAEQAYDWTSTTNTLLFLPKVFSDARPLDVLVDLFDCKQNVASCPHIAGLPHATLKMFP
jgi:hypothetical protein